MRTTSLAAVLMLATALPVLAQSPPIQVSQVGSAVISKFDHAEWRIDLGRDYVNPFDPDQVSVDGTFTDANGVALTTPAFWDKTEDTPGGAFYVRFAPPTAGRWSMTVSARDAKDQRTSIPMVFTVAASDRHGFVRVADNHRYLRFDNGSSYFPIGLNLAWPPGNERAEWYEKTFQTLAANGGNYARVWMAWPPEMLETNATGQRKYDLNSAAYYDHVLDSAEKHGIGVMLCFMNHRELIDHDMWGPADWVKSAYNAKNGGPATQPIDFFISDAAKQQFKARLRYIVARYGAYTSVAFWELFNEQEGAHLPIPVAWDRDMADYIRQVDPYQHLVTTSSVVPDAVWQLPAIAITQSHIYGDGTKSELVVPVVAAVSEYQKFDKPLLIGEFGIDYHGGDYTFDPTGKGTAFHNSLWSAALSGSAGTAMYWWWDSYIEPKNQWHEFQSIANFAATIDWAHRRFAPIEIQDLRRKQTQISYTDLTLPASGGWGVVARQPVTIPATGRLAKSLPSFLCGPQHHDQYVPLVMKIDLPQPSRLMLTFAKVSDYSVVRVLIDGKPVGDFSFSALPGAEGTTSSAFDTENKMYRADVVGPRTLPTTLTAGAHEVTLDPIAGDWVTLGAVNFTGALDTRYANLASVAVQDADSRETLAWVWDTRSNWQYDQSHDPQPQSDVQLTVPNIDHGDFTAEWWDTRKGKIIQTDHVEAADGKLTLNVPTFTRDIALRLRAATP